MLTPSPTPFPELNAVLSEWLDGVRAALGADLTAAYLQGSFAVGDFDEDSDVDFLVAVRAEPTDAQLAGLQALHARIYDLPSPWAKHLEGSYFPEAALRRFDPAGAQPWYLDNTSKVLVRSSHDDTLVTRWATREHGITLAGPDAKTLIDSVTAEDLRREVLGTMREWGAEILDGRYRLENRWAQPFAVLSYCRMLHTLRTGTVRSKLAGAQWAKEALDDQWAKEALDDQWAKEALDDQWAKEALDDQWAGLIGCAWNERPDPSSKVRQPADPGDTARTLDFIRYALEAGRQDTKPLQS